MQYVIEIGSSCNFQVSQGSVELETYLRWVGKFFYAICVQNFFGNLTVKIFKSVYTCRSYDHKSSVLFLRHTLTACDINKSLSYGKGKGKGKGFRYSLLSIRPGADPGIQAVSTQVTISHPPNVRLPLLSASPAVTFPAAEHHRPLAGTKLYCLVTEAHMCEQLVHGC